MERRFTTLHRHQLKNSITDTNSMSYKIILTPYNQVVLYLSTYRIFELEQQDIAIQQALHLRHLTISSRRDKIVTLKNNLRKTVIE